MSRKDASNRGEANDSQARPEDSDALRDWSSLLSGDEQGLDSLALELHLGNESPKQMVEGAPQHLQDDLARLIHQPSFLARQERMGQWMGSAIEDLQHWSGVDEERSRAVAEQVMAAVRSENASANKTLANHSIEPAGWRGDWAIVRGFLRARLAASPMLRLAAASLLAHMVAVPTIAAYLIWADKKEPELIIRWEPPREVLPEDPIAPPEPVTEEEERWSELGLETVNALAIARHTLGSTRHSLDGSTGLGFGLEGTTTRMDLESESELADALARSQDCKSWGMRSDDAGLYWRIRANHMGKSTALPIGMVPAESEPSVWHVLGLELLLDGYVFDENEALDWQVWTEPIWELIQVDGAPWEKQMGLAVLVRARSYGLYQLPEGFGLLLREHAGFSPGNSGKNSDGGTIPLGPDWAESVRPNAPLDADWRSLFAAGLQSSEATWCRAPDAWRTWLAQY